MLAQMITLWGGGNKTKSNKEKNIFYPTNSWCIEAVFLVSLGTSSSQLGTRYVEIYWETRAQLWTSSYLAI